MACRLCTRPTIGLGDEDGDLWDLERGNRTGAAQQRRQLLSKNSVTAAFSAQSLWSAGFQGKGVKMGVFDTGIRQDHPHVKNIKWACPQTLPTNFCSSPLLHSQTRCDQHLQVRHGAVLLQTCIARGSR